MNLNSPLSELSGLGPKTIEKLNRLGLFTARDLLFYFPRRYEDYTDITKIADVGNTKIQETSYKQIPNPKSQIPSPKSQSPAPSVYTIKGTVLGIANKKTRRRGFTVTEAQVVDDSGTLKVVWFNQPYLAKMLQEGSSVILNGKIADDYYSGGFVMESPTRTNYPRIVPVYGETEGITSWFISKIFGKLKHLIGEIEEWLPEEWLMSNVILSEAKNLRDPSATPQDDKEGLGLLPIQDAILNIHEPKNSEMLEQARRRLAFDELFLISLQSQIAKAEILKQQAEKIETDMTALKNFITSLPFELTADQKKAVWQISKDLAKPTPMNRLLSGDVGSGKTVVAAAAAFVTAKAGRKTVLMVPTSILANQHYETFCQLFKNYDIRIGLVTSERQEMNHESRIMNHGNKKDQKIHNSEFIIRNSSILIGTQALIQPDIKIDNLGLTVVDEQHRFGVRQREALQELSTPNTQHPLNIQQNNVHLLDIDRLKIENLEKMVPHFLSMTATPIPRTLYLALFGDLDVSTLTEKPANRKPVKTRLVDAFNRDKAYGFVRELINHGRQAFVVCPLIEDTGLKTDDESQGVMFEEERKTVMAESEKLKTIFPEFNIATLHGRMKAKEKDAIMADFAANKVQILVSTSVVEVGVDVPNAAVMLIEDAERFGLATIHQFRGRVGRAEHQSFCFLLSNSQSEKAISRLKSLEEISDGYKLAEIDLETRGFGSILGVEQSGVLDMKMANFCDKMLLVEAGKAAAKIVAKIDEYPVLKKRVEVATESRHLE
ncbi:MAG: ATP-dependent DNA helicase RecG [bacterium]|nr:ATP-dependent DNA helicase RecG [bacterium]